MANQTGYNATSAEILRSSQLSRELLISPQGKRYEDSSKAQKKLELKYMKKYSACTSGYTMNEVVESLPDVDFNKMKLDVAGNFYDPKVMSTMACVSNSLFLDAGPLGMYGNERLREYIHSLKQIGDESVSGFALIGSLQSAQDLFVVKAPRNPNNADELVHESMVALYGLNRLRAIIPNFAYVYGAFSCSAPFIDKKKVTAWCNQHSRGAVAYAIYENISPAESFSSYVKHCDFDAYIRYYLQAMLALRTAQNELGFTHYDAHGGNVLLRKINATGEFVWIPYKTRNGVEYIKTDGIVATFIDYGTSHIQLRDKNGRMYHFGYPGNPLIEYGVYRDRMHPLHDAYKLLLMTLRDIYVTRKPEEINVCFAKITPLLRFFNVIENPDQIITRQQKTYYYLPYNKKTAALTMDDWIEYIRAYLKKNNYEDPISSQPGGKIFGCTAPGARCVFNREEYKNVGISKDVAVPEEYLQFVDSLAMIQQTKNIWVRAGNRVMVDRMTQLTGELLDDFKPNIDKAAVKSSIKLQTLRERLSASNNALTLSDYDYKIFTPKILKEMTRHAGNLSTFFDSYQRAELELKAIEAAIKLYRPKEDNILMVLKTAYLNTLKEFKAKHFELKRKIETDIKWTDTTLALRNKLRKTDYIWYWNVYPNLRYVLM